MKYVSVPSEIHTSEILASAFCFAPGRYLRFIAPSVSGPTSFVPLDKLVQVRNSRLAARKGDPYRYAEIGDIDTATGGITFRPMRGYQLPTKTPSRAFHGDVLVSTVRTYRGGVGYVSDQGNDLVTTNALLNLCATTDFVPHVTIPYIYSFLRSDFFTEQVWSALNRGMYPRLDRHALDSILIPIATDERIFRYVSALTQVLIDKQEAIRDLSHTIDRQIQDELESHQFASPFVFAYPRLHDIQALGRLDAAIYALGYKSKIWLVENYTHGWTTPAEDGFAITPGPSLEIKLLRTRVDSDSHIPGYYALILPTNISEHGTLTAIPHLGTPRTLPLLQAGDIVFGEAGFQKGRSIVLLEVPDKCTTNAHGLYARRKDADLTKSIFFRCIFNWYRRAGLIDLMAVGGSGGHFSPQYFDYLKIPKFPDDKQSRIAQLYHNPGPPPPALLTLDTFVDWHRTWNAALGIWELDRQAKNLQHVLTDVHQRIITGTPVPIPI